MKKNKRKPWPSRSQREGADTRKKCSGCQKWKRAEEFQDDGFRAVVESKLCSACIVARRLVERSSEEPAASDHALLRYLQRHYGLDIDAFRAEMLDGVGGTVKVVRTGRFEAPNGLTYVVRNGIVVTVLRSAADVE